MFFLPLQLFLLSQNQKKNISVILLSNISCTSDIFSTKLPKNCIPFIYSYFPIKLYNNHSYFYFPLHQIHFIDEFVMHFVCFPRQFIFTFSSLCFLRPDEVNRTNQNKIEIVGHFCDSTPKQTDEWRMEMKWTVGNEECGIV